MTGLLSEGLSDRRWSDWCNRRRQSPYCWPGLGEQVSEKAGVLNIGIEGMMLLGAYTGFLRRPFSDRVPLARFSRRNAVGGILTALLMALSSACRLGSEPDCHRHRPDPGRRRHHRACCTMFQFSAHLSTAYRVSRRLACTRTVLTDLPLIGPVASSTRHPMVYLAIARRRSSLALGYSGAPMSASTCRRLATRPGALDVAAGNVVRHPRHERGRCCSPAPWPGLAARYIVDDRGRHLHPVHDRRGGLHRHRAGHAGPRPAALGPDRCACCSAPALSLTTALQVGGVERADRRGANAARCGHGDDRFGDLRTAGETAVCTRRILRTRLLASVHRTIPLDAQNVNGHTGRREVT